MHVACPETAVSARRRRFTATLERHRGVAGADRSHRTAPPPVRLHATRRLLAALPRILLLAAFSQPLAAQAGAPPAELAGAAACPPTSLLAGSLATVARQAEGSSSRLTDFEVASEGGRWNSALAVQLLPQATRLTFDLGVVRTLRSLLIQADANDTYLVEGSVDGQLFTALAEVPRLSGQEGLRTRAMRLPGSTVRFLRLSSSSGDGRASISEVQAFCTEPGAWEPRLKVIDTAEASARPARGWRWNDTSSRWWELALAFLGLALLLWDRRNGKIPLSAGHPAGKNLRRGLFAAAGLVATLTYFNFGAFHFGSYLHVWDTFHYYVGAKYFPELAYDKLYVCATVADATRESGESEAAYLARRSHAERRRIRNLRSNQLESTAALLAHPERCTAAFTAERWNSFRHDVAWFRQRESAERWDEIFADHGFNATPVWNLAGSALANLAPASDQQLVWLTLIDPLYFAGMVAMLVWAFGIPGAAVGLLVLATQFPARFFWTGGAFLRWDWLFFTVAAVALLRRERPFLGGVALAYAALLRIFPLFLAVGPLAILAATVTREMRTGDGTMSARWRRALRAPAFRPQLRFVAGGLVATALLVGLSLGVNGGSGVYRQFLANTVKHKATPLTNHLGLRTVASYRPAEIGRRLHAESAPEPWARWKEARLAAWARSRGVAAAVALLALALVARGAVRHRELWIGAALGAAFIPFAVELTSYYFAFLVVPALLFTVRRESGSALLLLGAFGLFISLAPLAGMPTWRDEQYTLIALATLLTLLFVLLRFAMRENLFHGPSSSV
jgi:hypothetical protein